jgi:hypothetical protein
MKLEALVVEAKKKEKKVVYNPNWNPQDEFPKDTITAIKKSINVFTKDLAMSWDNAMEMLDAVLIELGIPKPTANLRAQWEQYAELIEFSVTSMADARGINGSWNSIVR